MDDIKEGAECCCRTTVRGETEKKSLINRLSRIEGQIRGIRGMLERDAYCSDILLQSSAAGAAIDAFNRELLGSHIRHCVVSDMESGKAGAAEELIEALSRLLK